MPVMLLYRLAAFLSRWLGRLGFRSASTKTWRSRPIRLSTSCSRTVRAATSCALVTTNSVSERPARSAACWSRAFCSSVSRASSLAVLATIWVVPLMPFHCTSSRRTNATAIHAWRADIAWARGRFDATGPRRAAANTGRATARARRTPGRLDRCVECDRPARAT